MATKKKAPKKLSSGRGSPEAIEKRRTARQLNSLLGDAAHAKKLDGRTEKRRKRLIKELKDGRRGTPLKPIDVVSHVDELLQIGESLSTLRKQGVKARKTEVTDEVQETVERAQKAYGFRPEAWKILGIDLSEKRRGRPRKSKGRG